jgi:hypothetical protein
VGSNNNEPAEFKEVPCKLEAAVLTYSNRKLKNAINLYLKYGFKEVRLESTCHYKRADIKMSLSI